MRSALSAMQKTNGSRLPHLTGWPSEKSHTPRNVVRIISSFRITCIEIPYTTHLRLRKALIDCTIESLRCSVLTPPPIKLMWLGCCVPCASPFITFAELTQLLDQITTISAEVNANPVPIVAICAAPPAALPLAS